MSTEEKIAGEYVRGDALIAMVEAASAIPSGDGLVEIVLPRDGKVYRLRRMIEVKSGSVRVDSDGDALNEQHLEISQ